MKTLKMTTLLAMAALFAVPPVVHANEVRTVVTTGPTYYYQYYPSTEVYYDPNEDEYYWRDGSSWVHSEVLPYRLRERIGPYVVVESARDPWRWHDRIIRRYPHNFDRWDDYYNTRHYRYYDEGRRRWVDSDRDRDGRDNRNERDWDRDNRDNDSRDNRDWNRDGRLDDDRRTVITRPEARTYKTRRTPAQLQRNNDQNVDRARIQPRATNPTTNRENVTPRRVERHGVTPQVGSRAQPVPSEVTPQRTPTPSSQVRPESNSRQERPSGFQSQGRAQQRQGQQRDND